MDYEVSYPTILLRCLDKRQRVLILKIKDSGAGWKIVYPIKYRKYNIYGYFYKRIKAISEAEGVNWSGFRFEIIGHWK
jgi:hypothetical protein